MRKNKKMRKTFEGWLFNRIEVIGTEKYNHVGCEGEDKNFGEFLAQFVPEVGMRRKVKCIIEAIEESKIRPEYKRDSKRLNHEN